MDNSSSNTCPTLDPTPTLEPQQFQLPSTPEIVFIIVIGVFSVGLLVNMIKKKSNHFEKKGKSSERYPQTTQITSSRLINKNYTVNNKLLETLTD